MYLRALIFDVDGTIADTEEAHRQSFNDAFAREGLDWCWDADLYRELLKVTGGKERIGAFIGRLGLSAGAMAELEARIPAIHAAKTEFYVQRMRGGKIPLRAGVERLMEEAASRGVALAIATTTTRANIEALLGAHWGAAALQRFRCIGAGEDAKRKKPAGDIYELVLHRLQLRAQQCVAIEDSANGVRAAKAAGLFTIVAPSPWTEHENFELADWLLQSLDTGPGGRPLTVGSIDNALQHALVLRAGVAMQGVAAQ